MIDFQIENWTINAKTLTHNAFYLSKTAIFLKIAPTPPFILSKSTNDRFWKSKRVVQKLVGGEVGGEVRGKVRWVTRNISLRARPTNTLTYPWPRTIPCQLRSPKDIIKSQDNYLLGKNVLPLDVCTFRHNCVFTGEDTTSSTEKSRTNIYTL